MNAKPAVQFLRVIEWDIGNGQCRYCCGMQPGKWYGKLRPHPAAPTPQHEGHIEPCGLANALEALGEAVKWRQVQGLDEQRAPQPSES